MKKLIILLVLLMSSNFFLASKLYCADEGQEINDTQKFIAPEDRLLQSDLTPMPMMFSPEAMEVEEEFIDLMNQEGRSASSVERTIPSSTSVTSVSVASPRVLSSVSTENVTNSTSGGSMGYSKVLTDEECVLIYKNNASRAQASGDEEITTLLVEASEQLEYSLELRRQAEQVVNKKEASCLCSASSSARLIAFSLNDIVEYLVKEKSQDRGNSEIATLWRRAITQKQITIAYYRQSIEAYISGDEEKGNRLGRHWPSGSASWAAELSARELTMATEYLNKSQHAGNSEIAILFTKAAEQCEVASEYYRQAAKAYAQENKTEWKRLHYAANSTAEAAHHLKETSASLEKASESERNGKNSIAALWIKSSEQFKTAAEYYAQAVQAYAANNKEEGKSCVQKAMREDPTLQSLFQNGGFGFGGVKGSPN